jgi:cytochrome c-type biogenesis protein CcmH/NrfG
VQSLLFVYGRNHTQWDDVRKAAAFITSRDPLLEGFTRPALVAYEPEIKTLGKWSHNLMRALVLFELVEQHGVRYLADPNSPYAQKAGDRAAVDEIQYPAEVLRKKTGDCDDLTALYCALLENAGVSTALVDYPEHLFMMFDTGLSRQEAGRLPVDEALYFVRLDRIWMPVEVTLLGQSFYEAWRAGAEELRALSLGEFRRRIVDTAEAWQEYAPAGLSLAGEVMPPEPAEVAGAVREQQALLQREVEAYIAGQYLTPLQANPQDPRRRSELAEVYVALRRYAAAIAEYRRLLESEGEQAWILNGLGIASYLDGQFEQAVQFFQQAVERQPEQKELRANLDKALRALGQGAGPGATPPREAAVKGAAPEVDEDYFYWLEYGP